MYHGWSDAAIPAPNSIDYYASVVKTMGQRKTDSFLRLFMVPGMQHCGGGPGPNYFGQSGDGKDDDPEHNLYAAIEQWVERGVAPSKIIATKYANDFKPGESPKLTRPLCPYPQIAKYKGTGDKNDAASFVCEPGNK
jgi:Tannase and feruloyl esterase